MKFNFKSEYIIDFNIYEVKGFLRLLMCYPLHYPIKFNVIQEQGFEMNCSFAWGYNG